MEDVEQRERARCVSICRRRAELWLKRVAANAPAAVLQEAQARANEAAYLADLLESGVDLADLGATSGSRGDA